MCRVINKSLHLLELTHLTLAIRKKLEHPKLILLMMEKRRGCAPTGKKGIGEAPGSDLGGWREE